ncbi:ras-related protein Rab-26 isoform X2 [Moschus berezovskii]|uniref:ras-related protein Rab-26 isoform X2 n=1 Tax=Moschus berezovskii TaxID=68408 RepID=UPI002444A030|nr:ras-related protein Rab-26 isoform X2 [Moschus berezovskii]
MTIWAGVAWASTVHGPAGGAQQQEVEVSVRAGCPEDSDPRGHIISGGGQEAVREPGGGPEGRAWPAEAWGSGLRGIPELFTSGSALAWHCLSPHPIHSAPTPNPQPRQRGTGPETLGAPPSRTVHQCQALAGAGWLFQNKVVDVDGMKVKLQIWDTAGQERFRSVTHAYYRDAHALLLLYDVTNKASFDSIQAWLTEIQEHAQDDVVLMLLGNKVDSAQERAVKREDAEKLAKDYGLPFMETSAKTGLNVDLAFTAIAKELKQRHTKAPGEPRFQLHDYVKREGRGASCCRP